MALLYNAAVYKRKNARYKEKDYCLGKRHIILKLKHHTCSILVKVQIIYCSFSIHLHIELNTYCDAIEGSAGSVFKNNNTSHSGECLSG